MDYIFAGRKVETDLRTCSSEVGVGMFSSSNTSFDSSFHVLKLIVSGFSIVSPEDREKFSLVYPAKLY